MSADSTAPVFRWLHISDLHIDEKKEDFINYIINGNRYSHDQYENKGLSGILGNRGVDCVISTGDFFHKGGLGEDQQKAVQDTVTKILTTCKIQDFPECFCFCPGNHDLNRNVGDSVNHHQVTTRSDCIKKAADTHDAFLGGNEVSKKIIVQYSFEEFYNTLWLDRLKGCDAVRIIGDKQIICFSPSAKDPGFPAQPVFIGFNTALLAGQSDDTGKINDDGKLCLPDEESIKQLIEHLTTIKSGNQTIIPIFFGHHSTSFFNEKAKTQLMTLMDEQGIPVYLCGHSHQLSDVPIETNRLTHGRAFTCLEVIMGGLFYDKEKYNHLSFSVGTISIDVQKEYSFLIDHYICLYGNDSERIGIWMHGQSKWPVVRSFYLNNTAQGEQAESIGDQTGSPRETTSYDKEKNKENQGSLTIARAINNYFDTK